MRASELSWDRLLRHSRLYTFLQWTWRQHAPEQGVIYLSQRRVYILPTRQGLVFGLAMALMLIGSINYNLSLGYVLTFLLAGMGLVSILHTFRNLAYLHVSAGRVEPVFAGDRAQFALHLENRGNLGRHSVRMICEAERIVADIAPRAIASVSIPVPATQRGWLALPRVTLETNFPMGLLRAWSYVRPDVRVLVYPKPDNSELPPAQVRADSGDSISIGAGNDDYAGMRAYQPSDSPRHIAWKAAARSDDMLTKQFSGRAASEMWLDWDAIPVHLGLEAGLSRLARWVLLADANGLRYGLRLPGVEIPIGEGPAQQERCLRELALYEA